MVKKCYYSWLWLTFFCSINLFYLVLSEFVNQSFHLPVYRIVVHLCRFTTEVLALYLCWLAGCVWLIFPSNCHWSDLMVSTCWKQTASHQLSGCYWSEFSSKTDWTLMSVLNNAAFCEYLPLGVWDWGASALWVFRSVRHNCLIWKKTSPKWSTRPREIQKKTENLLVFLLPVFNVSMFLCLVFPFHTCFLLVHSIFPLCVMYAHTWT